LPLWNDGVSGLETKISVEIDAALYVGDMGEGYE
jgi:hypothetical protein